MWRQSATMKSAPTPINCARFLLLIPSRLFSSLANQIAKSHNFFTLSIPTKPSPKPRISAHCKWHMVLRPLERSGANQLGTLPGRSR